MERRTLEFGINLINVLKKLPKDLFNNKLISQAISAGTSIGANYREASASESPKDFKHKINISFKEAKEVKYFLTLIISANQDFNDELLVLFKESDELMRIFGKSVTTCRQNIKCQMSDKKSDLSSEI